ncbi:hypothetical protein GY45DRAFT_1365866 [Cubamyces sp. BRFM 1775]|nr:hypothetical protein GY45DRAFT_1365866 [Cubamyces sp. BRFM 1775]
MRTDSGQRTIGFVLHAKPIAVSGGTHKFTSYWALMISYENKIDWDSFKSNKVNIVRNPSLSDDRNAGYEYSRNGSLQAYGVVKDNVIRSPQQLDANGDDGRPARVTPYWWLDEQTRAFPGSYLHDVVQ